MLLCIFMLALRFRRFTEFSAIPISNEPNNITFVKVKLHLRLRIKYAFSVRDISEIIV